MHRQSNFSVKKVPVSKRFTLQELCTNILTGRQSSEVSISKLAQEARQGGKGGAQSSHEQLEQPKH